MSLSNYPLHEQMVVNVLHTGNHIDRLISALFKQYDLTHVQYNILRILKGAFPAPLMVGEVKARVMFSNADVTRLIDRLVAKGVVSRENCKENRRRVLVRITKSGEQLLIQLKPQIENTLCQFYSDLITEEEAELMINILTKIRTTNE
jgi:DNA-binding MarR family transcriptional regulator